MTHQLLHLGNLSDLDYEGSCMQCLMQLIFWWNSLVPLIWKVTHKRAEAWEKGWREPDFLFTDQCVLQTNRLIINPERFLYSRANMNPNAIELLNRDDTQPEQEVWREEWLMTRSARKGTKGRKNLGNCRKINCCN